MLRVRATGAYGMNAVGEAKHGLGKSNVSNMKGYHNFLLVINTEENTAIRN